MQSNLLSRNMISKLLPQAATTSQDDLEVQRRNSVKIVELSQTVASMQNISREVLKISSQLVDILDLVHESQSSKSEVQTIAKDISILTKKALGELHDARPIQH